MITKITFGSLLIIIFQTVETLNYALKLFVSHCYSAKHYRFTANSNTIHDVLLWGALRKVSHSTRLYKIVPLLQLIRLCFMQLIVWKMKVDAQIIIRRIPHVLWRIDNCTAYGTISYNCSSCVVEWKKKYRTRQMYEYHVREITRWSKRSTFVLRIICIAKF